MRRFDVLRQDDTLQKTDIVGIFCGYLGDIQKISAGFQKIPYIRRCIEPYKQLHLQFPLFSLTSAWNGVGSGI
jgi:hypothetical protein